MDTYQLAVARVLSQTESYSPRDWAGRRQKLARGVPFRFAGNTVYGPQAATVTVQLRPDGDDLRRVEPAGERFALASASHFCHVYRHLNLVRIEFTLPADKWRVVPFAGLPQHRDALAIGQQATGAVARLDWRNPHKAVFGATQYGKSTFLVDYLVAIAKTYRPDECKIFVCNPKDDTKFHPFHNLAHLGHPIMVDYAACERLLMMGKVEALARRGDLSRCKERWVFLVDEVAELVDNRPGVGDIVKSLSQIAGGLNVNLVAASQSANPSVFGGDGHKAKTNFGTRIIFNLPSSQAYLATDVGGRQYPVERLGAGGKGDGIVVSNGQVTRFRAALPSLSDFEGLLRVEAPVAMSQLDQPIGDMIVDLPSSPSTDFSIDWKGKGQTWTPDDLGRYMAWSLINHASAEAIRREFRIGTDRATVVKKVLEAMTLWRGKYKSERNAK